MKWSLAQTERTGCLLSSPAQKLLIPVITGDKLLSVPDRCLGEKSLLVALPLASVDWRQNQRVWPCVPRFQCGWTKVLEIRLEPIAVFIHHGLLTMVMLGIYFAMLRQQYRKVALCWIVLGICGGQGLRFRDSWKKTRANGLLGWCHLSPWDGRCKGDNSLVANVLMWMLYEYRQLPFQLRPLVHLARYWLPWLAEGSLRSQEETSLAPPTRDPV